jgi:hypothetical protein
MILRARSPGGTNNGSTTKFSVHCVAALLRLFRSHDVALCIVLKLVKYCASEWQRKLPTLKPGFNMVKFPLGPS